MFISNGPRAGGELAPYAPPGGCAGAGSDSPGYASAGYRGPLDSQPGLLVEYWRTLRRRAGTLVVVWLIGTAAGLAFALCSVPSYEAHATVEIQDINQDFLNVKQITPVSELGSGQAMFDLKTQIRILQSDTLVARALARTKERVPAGPAARRSIAAGWLARLGFGREAAGGEHRAETVRQAQTRLAIRAARETRILEISYTSPDAAFAAAFVNALVEDYIQRNSETRWVTNQQTRKWLARQAEEIRDKLSQSEAALQQYARGAGLLFTSETTNVGEDKLRRLQDAVAAAQADRMAKESRYAIAKTSAPETLSDILNDNSVRDYQTKLADLRRRRSELATTYAPGFPALQRIDAEIASLTAELQRQRAAIVNRMRNDYDEAARKEAMLSGAYARQAERVRTDGEKTIQYNILKRDVDTNRQLYDAMLQHEKDATLASAMSSSNVRILDPAAEPSEPAGPSLPLSVGAGTAAGLFCGAGLVILRERSDRSIKAPGEASACLGVPELAVIPSGRTAASRRRLPLSVVPSDAVPACVELAACASRTSLIGESFRAALASLLFSPPGGGRRRTFVVTSANPREGKSTIASNLAIAMACLRRRVLLIDGDMRGPRLHEIFRSTNEPGLSNALADGAGPRDIVEAARETNVPGLYLLPSGPRQANASDLLHSEKLKALLDYAAERFDMVVVDTPPMLVLPDARLVSRAAHGTILVARFGKTTYEALQAVKQRLSDDGSLVVGTILNDWNPGTGAGGYYGAYGSGYRRYAKYL